MSTQGLCMDLLCSQKLVLSPVPALLHILGVFSAQFNPQMGSRQCP